VSADKCDGIEWLSHTLVEYILPEDGRYEPIGREPLIVANSGAAAKSSTEDNLDISAMSCQRNFTVSFE